MSVNPISWRTEYAVAVTRGRRTRYSYGQTLKEALAHAKLREGEGFAYAKFERGPVQWAEHYPSKGTLVHHGPMKRTKAA